MSTYAVIESGVVTNIAVCDDPAFAASQGWVGPIDAITPTPGIGWLSANGVTWTAPAPSTPDTSASDLTAAIATLQAVADPTTEDPSQQAINQAMATVVLAGTN